MMALTARVSCCVFRVLGFNSNLFNLGPPSQGKLNPNGRAGPKLDWINNSGLKCYWACDFFLFFLLLGKPWIRALFFFFFFSLTHILFFYSWMIKLYLVTCFSCDNMTYRLGGFILSWINDIHVHN